MGVAPDEIRQQAAPQDETIAIVSQQGIWHDGREMQQEQGVRNPEDVWQCECGNWPDWGENCDVCFGLERHR